MRGRESVSETERRKREREIREYVTNRGSGRIILMKPGQTPFTINFQM